VVVAVIEVAATVAGMVERILYEHNQHASTHTLSV